MTLFVETFYRVTHTGLADGDQVTGVVPCESRDEAETVAARVREWQDGEELPVDAVVQVRRGSGPWTTLTHPVEIGAAA